MGHKAIAVTGSLPTGACSQSGASLRGMGVLDQRVQRDLGRISAAAVVSVDRWRAAMSAVLT